MKEHVHAEAVWLFLVDEAKGVLWNEETGGSPEFTVPLSAGGLVGATVLTKDKIRLANPQAPSPSPSPRGILLQLQL